MHRFGAHCAELAFRSGELSVDLLSDTSDTATVATTADRLLVFEGTTADTPTALGCP